MHRARRQKCDPPPPSAFPLSLLQLPQAPSAPGLGRASGGGGGGGAGVMEGAGSAGKCVREGAGRVGCCGPSLRVKLAEQEDGRWVSGVGVAGWGSRSRWTFPAVWRGVAPREGPEPGGFRAAALRWGFSFGRMVWGGAWSSTWGPWPGVAQDCRALAPACLDLPRLGSAPCEVTEPVVRPGNRHWRCWDLLRSFESTRLKED